MRVGVGAAGGSVWRRVGVRVLVAVAPVGVRVRVAVGPVAVRVGVRLIGRRLRTGGVGRARQRRRRAGVIGAGASRRCASGVAVALGEAVSVSVGVARGVGGSGVKVGGSGPPATCNTIWLSGPISLRAVADLHAEMRFAGGKRHRARRPADRTAPGSWWRRSRAIRVSSGYSAALRGCRDFEAAGEIVERVGDRLRDREIQRMDGRDAELVADRAAAVAEIVIDDDLQSGRRLGSVGTLSNTVVPIAAPSGGGAASTTSREAEAGVVEVDRRAVRQRSEWHGGAAVGAGDADVDDARTRREGDQVGGRDAPVAIDVGTGARRPGVQEQVVDQRGRWSAASTTPSQSASRTSCAAAGVVTAPMAPRMMAKRARLGMRGLRTRHASEGDE